MPPPPPQLLLLFTGGCPSPAPRSGGTDPNRVRLHQAPSSRTRASPLRLLTLSSAGRAHRRGVPGRAGGGERAAQAARGALEGTCGRGPAGRGGDPVCGPASPAARANCLGSQPRAGRAGASWSPEVGAPNTGGGIRGAGVSHAPPGLRLAAPQQPFSLPCRWPVTRAAAGARGALDSRLPTIPRLAPAHDLPTGPAPWSRPVLTRTRDSPACAHPAGPRNRGVSGPPGVARVPAVPFPRRAAEPGPTRTTRRLSPTNERSARARLRSFSKKKPFASAVYSCKSAALFPGASPSSAPSSCLFLFFFLKREKLQQHTKK